MSGRSFLVTGAHGDIALSIGRILKEFFPGSKILGTDCDSIGVGQLKFENFFLIPRVDHPDYTSEIKRIVEKENVDLIIPTSEPEIKYLNLHNPLFGKCNYLTLDPKITSLCFDKLATANFLRDNGLPYLHTTSSLEGLMSFPFIVKPRFGAGSAGIRIIRNAHELPSDVDASNIYQKYVGTPEMEFTSCVYSDGNLVRDITLKRKLKYGVTVYAERVEVPAISKLLTSIAQKMNLNGSINVQLRLVDGIPFVFEINPRFSSTVYYRHCLGFQDVVWSIKKKLGENFFPDSKYMDKKFYRYFTEDVV